MDGQLVAEMTPLADPVYKRHIDFEDIPKHCNEILLLSEDRNYYSHIGVDAAGILRKGRDLLTGQNSGSATITQQLVKISEQTAGSSLINQYADAVQAVRINFALSKDQVLELYWNNVYLGQYNYGLEAAANDYFDKPAKELNKVECAFIVGTISSPNSYNPYINQGESIKRTEGILEMLNTSEYISDTEYDLLDPAMLDFDLTGQPSFTRTQLECLASKLSDFNGKLDQDLEVYTDIEQLSQLDSCNYKVLNLE